MSMKQQGWVKPVKHLQPGTDGVRGRQGVTVFLLHEGTLLEWQEGYSHHRFAKLFTGMALKSFSPPNTYERAQLEKEVCPL